MLNDGEKILLALGAGEFLLGFLGNGFIALVISYDWIKTKKLTTMDLILLWLAISRIGLLCTISWGTFENLFCLDISLPDKMTSEHALWILTHLASIWFATCLSVFYFLKISNFSHPLFLWLKWRTNQVIRTLMMGPFLFSLFLQVPLMERFYSYIVSKTNKTKAFQENEVSEAEYIISQVIVNLFSLVPFTLSLVSFFFLLLSFWRHNQTMEHNATGFRDISTEVHVRAMKAMLSFFILFLLFYLSSFITQFISIISNQKLVILLGIPMIILYPSGHSLILILYNSKLNKAALKVWWHLRCCLKKKEMRCLLP